MAKETGLGIGPIRSCCWLNATLEGKRQDGRLGWKTQVPRSSQKLTSTFTIWLFFFFSFFWNSQPVAGDLVC